MSKIKNIVCAILSIILAGVIVFLLYTENQQEKAQSAAIEAAQEEAAPYEKELKELKNELSNLEDGVSYSSEKAELMLGFVASAVSDLDYIDNKASTYKFSPVLIIDCTMGMDVIEDILETADESWEVMLYTPTFSEEVNEELLSVMAYLEEEGKEQTGVFFLRSDYSTDSNMQMLKEDGFLGYTSYHSESPTAGQTEDGTIYFDYSYLSAEGTSVSNRVSATYDRKASMIVAFDMNSIKEGTLTEAYVTELFDMLQDYAEKDSCSFSTVADVVNELSEVNSIEASNQAEYEKQAAEIQERIAELEEIIDEIYDTGGL